MNELTQLLENIADGNVPLKYRQALQELIKQKGRSLLRATYYDELLKRPDIKNPISMAMKKLHASRSTIYRDHALYKHLFKELS